MKTQKTLVTRRFAIATALVFTSITTSPLFAQLGEETVPSGQIMTKGVISRQIEVTQKVNFSNILFKINSTEFTNRESSAQIKEIAAALAKDWKGTRFIIEGHTCDLGTDAHNRDLSKRRAEAVKRLLVAAGVPATMLLTGGGGEASPIRPNDSEVNRALNRRVTVKLAES